MSFVGGEKLISIVTEGANGDGMAVVSSLRSFDREQQKEYLVPIVIKDSGNPPMTGTSTLTVIIGDSNDNKMQPGSKDILVYNYMVILRRCKSVHSFNISSCRVSRLVPRLVVFTYLTKMTGTLQTRLSTGRMARLIPTSLLTQNQVRLMKTRASLILMSPQE